MDHSILQKSDAPLRRHPRKSDEVDTWEERPGEEGRSRGEELLRHRGDRGFPSSYTHRTEESPAPPRTAMPVQRDVSSAPPRATTPPRTRDIPAPSESSKKNLSYNTSFSSAANPGRTASDSPPGAQPPSPTPPPPPKDTPEPPAEESVETLLLEGREALRQGKAQHAQRLACRGLVLDPDNVSLLILLGDALYESGDVEAAADEWRTALTLDAANPELRRRVEQAELRLGKTTPETKTSPPSVNAEVVIEAIDGQAVETPKKPAATAVEIAAQLGTLYLVGGCLALLIGWALGLIEAIFDFRLHLLLAAAIGFVLGRFLDVDGGGRRLAVSAGQRALCGALLALLALAATLYTPYLHARSRAESGGAAVKPTLLRALEQARATAPQLALEEPDAPALDNEPREEAAENADQLRATPTPVWVTSSFGGYLMSRAAHPFDFYRVELPGFLLWILWPVEAMIAIVVTFQVGGIFK